MSSQTKFRRFFYNKTAIVGLVIIVVVSVVTLLAPLLPIAHPNITELSMRVLPPGSEGHLLGTDQLGRDILSRLIWGTRISLAVGVSATAIAALIGSLIGIFSAFYSGVVDNVLMRGIDMLMAFPYILLALAIVAVLGPGLFNALIAISIVNIPFFARNVRGATVGLVRLEYIEAARLSGKNDMKILFGELLPNVLPVIVITISTTVGWMILETAGLSFLGLGAQPPTPDLGSMLGDGRSVILNAPHVATLPGLVILVLVIGINLVGDGLRDVLDPYLRAGALVSPRPATEVDRGLLARKRAQKRSAARRVDGAGAGDGPGAAGDSPGAAGDSPGAAGDSPGAAGEPAGDSSGASAEVPLSVRNLRTWFMQRGEPVHAADGVSFDVGRGRSLGIMGESGSGKTVTALSILGLVPTPPGRIMEGSVLYKGEDLVGAPLEQLRFYRGNRIAYIFQNPMTSLNPLYTIGEQIAEAVRRHQPVTREAARKKAGELMELVQIPDARRRIDDYPHQLSGGMRQRIGIAIALANDPDVIIADEPTTALDVTIQAQILRLLEELRKEYGMSLVFISHDFGVISSVCERVVVMYAGEVVEVGTVEEIYEQPLHPYTRRLMACVPKIGDRRKTMDAIPGLPPALDGLPVGCRFADRCDMAIAACRENPVPITAVDPVSGAVSAGGDRQVRCIRAEEIVAGTHTPGERARHD